MMAYMIKFDRLTIFFINRYLRNKYLDIFMCVMSRLGDVGSVWIALAIYLMINKENRYEGEIVLVTLLISTIIGEGILKNLIKRSRPFKVFKNIKVIINKPTTYSFPSGHTLSSFAVAGVLSGYFGKYGIAFTILAFLIAISRVYLYIHYLSDIIGGMLIGIILSRIILEIL